MTEQELEVRRRNGAIYRILHPEKEYERKKRWQENNRQRVRETQQKYYMKKGRAPQVIGGYESVTKITRLIKQQKRAIKRTEKELTLRNERLSDLTKKLEQALTNEISNLEKKKASIQKPKPNA